MATKKKTSSSSSSTMPDWSLLPKELLHIISKNVDDCFDLVHARSVCTSWRSTFPSPASVLRPSYSLPTFPIEKEGLCTLEKFPLFLFSVRAPTDADAAVSVSDFFLGGVDQDKSEDHTELPSPIQCSVKVKIPGSESDPTMMNIRNRDCQIIPLGQHYRMIGWEYPKKYIGVAFLPLNKDGGGGGEFAVLIGYAHALLVLTSVEMRWILLRDTQLCPIDLVAFKGRFYATFIDGKVVVIDPYSLDVTPLMPPHPRAMKSLNYLVPSGNDELFLVELIIKDFGGGDDICRVSRLDDEEEEASKWVEVSDLSDRVFFIGSMGSFSWPNVSCSAKELPDGCGVSGNSILFTSVETVTFFYKYGPYRGNAEEEELMSCWRFSRENRVSILSTSSPVVAFRVEH